MKNVRRTKIEQIKTITIERFLCILVTRPTPNQKGSAGEHRTMSVTWAGSVPAGLHESRGEIPG
jgi:hypothetical protein